MGGSSGDKAKLDVREKTDVRSDRDRPAQTATDEEDRFGTLASGETARPGTPINDDRQRMEGALSVVQQSFHWFNEAAQRQIEVLRTDLNKQDEPDWFSQIASALLEVALGAGAAAAGVRLAARYAPAAGEVGGEFVKMLFEGGLGAGISAGRAKLGGGHEGNVVDPFFEAQKDGVEATQMANQTQFLRVKRYQVSTVQEAQKLADACSRDNIIAAADDQYRATRDAWVSYLAQTKFGAVGSRGAVQKHDYNVGPTTTNMSSEAAREQTNRRAPGFVPGDAPSLNASMQGEAPGILQVLADLPWIVGSQMIGKPTVELALLNGVNSTLRKQYEGVPLDAMRIPRQVVARVSGAPDFTLSVNENGEHNHLNPKERTWLAARAAVGHPESASSDEWQRSEAGVRLLLQDLIPRTIQGRFL